jgi:hypothetical protein
MEVRVLYEWPQTSIYTKRKNSKFEINYLFLSQLPGFELRSFRANNKPVKPLDHAATSNLQRFLDRHSFYEQLWSFSKNALQMLGSLETLLIYKKIPLFNALANIIAEQF